MTDDPTGEQGGGAASPTPAVRASDAEREAVVTRLQIAVGEGRLDLDEFGQRAAAAYAAGTTAELAELVADLPGPGLETRPAVEVVGERGDRAVSSVFGDIRVSPTTGPPERASTVFGDIRIDLRGLRSSAETLHLQLGTVFGDVEVIVSEGVAAEIEGWTVLGDRRTELAPVQRLPGTPRVLVRGRTVVGDLRLRSLAPGQSPSRWRALLDRLADRRPGPPPLS